MKIVSGSGFDNSFGDLTVFSDATLSGASTTQFTLNTGISTVVCSGTGFNYSGGHPNGGTITHITYDGQSNWIGTDLSVSVSALWSAIAANDPASFNNLLFSGDDTFDLRNATTVWAADGGAGNDTFYFKGFDHFSVDGGAGNDTIIIQGMGGQDVLEAGGTSIELIKLINGYNYNLAADPDNAQKIDASALISKYHVKEDA